MICSSQKRDVLSRVNERLYVVAESEVDASLVPTEFIAETLYSAVSPADNVVSE